MKIREFDVTIKTRDIHQIAVRKDKDKVYIIVEVKVQSWHEAAEIMYDAVINRIGGQ